MLNERGSVLALVPAGFLVLMVLAALAVDNAATYLGQRQLHDSLAAAANDAVTAGLSSGSFYGAGHVALDPAEVERAVCLAVASQGDRSLHGLQLWMAVEGDMLQLRGRATVPAVFGRLVPGFGARQVSAEAAAVAAAGPLSPTTGSGAPAAYVPLLC